MLHETDGPGGDVRAGVEGDAPSRWPPTRSARARRGGRRRRRPRRRARSTWRSPTDLLGAPSCRRTRPSRPARSSRRHRDGELDAAVALLDRAERPLLWVGGGARDAGAEVARAGRAARRAGAHHLRRARACCRPAHPCLVGLPPHVSRRGRAVGRGRRRASRSARDLDGMQTQNFAQPQPPTLIAINLDAAGRGKNYRVDVAAGGRRRARSRATLAERVPSAAGCDALAERLHEVRAQALRRARRDARCASSTRSRFALPDDAIVVADMCIPGYWLAGLPHARRRRASCSPARLGHARLRVPGRARRRARGRRARSSRSPATAASCTPAASWPRWRRSRSR